VDEDVMAVLPEARTSRSRSVVSAFPEGYNAANKEVNPYDLA
jgi:hypothetical protein